jgi:hypothetical protein
MIRLPTTEEEETHIRDTFPDDDLEAAPPEHRFQDDDDDDIPPPVPNKNAKSFKLNRNEADFFDVSDDEDETHPPTSTGQDEGTKAWRD